MYTSKRFVSGVLESRKGKIIMSILLQVAENRWVVKALTLYSDSDWREILECVAVQPEENEGPPCGNQVVSPFTQMPLDPRTYCGKQYLWVNYPTVNLGCHEFWRTYKFVGTDGYLRATGYSNMNLTFYPHRHTQYKRIGIKIVPCSADGTETDDIPEKQKYGPFTEKQFTHWNKLVFTRGDTMGSPDKIPTCMDDFCYPMIKGNFKIRIHFLGTDGREEKESNKNRDGWMEKNTIILGALGRAVLKIKNMCSESNTGFTVSLLNSDIWCHNDSVHAGVDYLMSSPYTFPFACGSGETADMDIWFGEKDQIAAAMGSAWNEDSMHSFAGMQYSVGQEHQNEQARASQSGAILIPRRAFFNVSGGVDYNPEKEPTNVKYRALFLEEIGHAMGLKWDRVEIPMSETMFHDFAIGGRGMLANYTSLDKKAFEIMYLRYKDGTSVFNTEMEMVDAQDAFNKWVAEYNSDDSSGGGVLLPEHTSKHVELSGVEYVLRDGPSSVYDEGDQDRNPAEMLWGNLNGVYTLRTNDMTKKQVWEKKEPMPPKEIIISGACGVYGPHDTKWDGSGGGGSGGGSYSSRSKYDSYDFKWVPNINGKYVQYWPLDADTLGKGLKGATTVFEQVPSEGAGMGGARESGPPPPQIPDYLASVTKKHWTPNTYSGTERLPEPGEANYMEVFDRSHICWQYPIYIKYPARAKIYEGQDGIADPEGCYPPRNGAMPRGDDAGWHVGLSPIMDTEFESEEQPEDYFNENMESNIGANGNSLFALEYLKIFVSYYRVGSYGSIVPTLGPAHETDDPREDVTGGSLGPTWMIVRSDAVPPGDGGSLKNVRIVNNKDIYDSYAYGGINGPDSRRDVSRRCMDDRILWIFNPKMNMSAEGQFHLDGLNHKLPPDGPEWKYLGDRMGNSWMSGPCGGGEITLKTSGNGWYTHQIELQKLSSKRPDSKCSE